MHTRTAGRVVGVRGSVVDAEFDDALPAINEAIHVSGPAGAIVVEVRQHLSRTRVRGIAMGFTDGLARGVAARATGEPITVPVGDAVLGRMINVLGEPLDERGPIGAGARRPIHAPGPAVAAQRTQREVFATGMKVIDLLAPLAKGGKAGLFGGAGVGKTVLIMELIR